MEEYKTNFKDFESDYSKLIGKYVLYESGVTYGAKSKSICKIIKVTKSGFKINGVGNENKIFYFYGSQKGLTGRMNIGTISECTLLTAEEAQEISTTWKKNRHTKELRKKILAEIENINLEKLEEINKILFG